MKSLTCLIFLLFLSLITPFYILAEGTYSNIGTSDAGDGDSDAINFSQGRVWTIDKYGKYIWLTQKRSNSQHHWAYSNDQGASWTQSSEGYDFLLRGSVAYDSTNDKLHVIWEASDSNDGIIYRRYSITRDGSNNITDIARQDSGTINLQLDTTSSRSLTNPVALWVNDGTTNGILVAIWSKYGTSLTEIRASMRRLSYTSADGSAGNWIALDGSSDTFSTDAPAVAADKIYGSTSTGKAVASANVRGGSGSRKDDFYIFVAEAITSGNSRLLGYRGVWSSGSLNWSGGWQSPVTVGQVDNSSGGYNLKHELVSKPVTDTSNDRIYIGWARWKDSSAGDTVSFAYLDSSDTVSSTIDAYSANGTHSYAPTLDTAFDSTLGNFYIAYIESTTNGDNGSINYKTYDGSTLSSSTRFYTTTGGSGGQNGSADIPVLYQSRSTNNRLLFAFRVNGAIPPTSGNPHTIYWGYVTLPTATPTPTVTPTPQASSNTNQTNSSTTTHNPHAAPGCGKAKPPTAPFLFGVIAQSKNSIKIYQVPISHNATHYVLEFGVKSGQYIYSSPNFGNSNTWTYTVKNLSPNTRYYFRTRASNGCATGPWSKEVSATTK